MKFSLGQFRLCRIQRSDFLRGTGKDIGSHDNQGVWGRGALLLAGHEERASIDAEVIEKGA
jgi:hypothetical protein